MCTIPHFSILVLLVTFMIGVDRTTAQNCTINARMGLHDFAPLIVHADTLEFVYPAKGSPNLNLRKGHKLSVICPGRRNSLNVTSAYLRQASITCEGPHFSFSETDLRLPMDEIKCVRHPQSYAKKDHLDLLDEFPVCERHLHAIGFWVGTDRFAKVLQTCFDPKVQSPVIAHAIVYPFLKNQQRRPQMRMRFNTALVNGKVARAYTRNEQIKTFQKILGYRLAEKYITPMFYLQRGHLMARADFYYQSQQVSSYYYLNVVPMWSTINGGNWASLEMAVRDFSASIKKELQVWTGSFGVLEFEDEFGNHQPIFLLDNSLVPVPKFLFKIVYEKSRNQAVVFVTINNPFLSELSSVDIVCNDVMDEIGWVRFSEINAIRGFTYACYFDDFQRVFDIIPKLSVDGLLSGL